MFNCLRANYRHARVPSACRSVRGGDACILLTHGFAEPGCGLPRRLTGGRKFHILNSFGLSPENKQALLDLFKDANRTEESTDSSILVSIGGDRSKARTYPRGVRLLDVLPTDQQKQLFACLVDGKVQDIRYSLQRDADITPILHSELHRLAESVQTEAANEVAWRTASLLVSIAALQLFGCRVRPLQGAVDKDKGGFSIDLLILRTPTPSNFQNWEHADGQATFLGRLSDAQLEELQQHAIKLTESKHLFEEVRLDDSSLLEGVGLQVPRSEGGKVTLWKFQDVFFTCDKPIARSASQIQVLELSASELVHHVTTKRQCVTRVYGIGFGHSRMKERWLAQIELAKQSDHRALGRAQGLFMTHRFSPGAPFFLPHGTRIIRRLQDFLRSKYRRFGFEEVMTPLVYKKELWEISGHWENYQSDMFAVRGCCDTELAITAGLKPMNCPAHCLVFDSVPRSASELPLRLADFSALHRNETSSLTGLVRVSQFHQDDGHIFCRRDQIASEITATLDMLAEVYRALTFSDYELTLSTRPENKFIGTEAEWAEAESALRRSLEGAARPWSIKEGEGAFYGPKIDVMVKDSLGNAYQTATIQLDFQLPARFNLKYKLPDGGSAAPVIIHRAVFGSIERILAILTEHYRGRWPFWLNPRQAIICPTVAAQSYAESVHAALSQSFERSHLPIHLDLDRSKGNLSTMIKSAQQAQYSLMLVVGPREVTNQTVSVRTRAGVTLGEMSLADVTAFITDLQINHKA
ncbi:hypothetical protein L0F63_006543 [Massospora cicadina]|nr:hypothetical protein L0F63_006543 [Massospora cicadina]